MHSFLALGDIHLDPVIWRRLKAVTGDAEVAFKSFIDLGLQLNIPLVIVGDLFDVVNPPSEMTKVFREQMDRCQTAGVPVYAIQGNHDKTVPPWYNALHDWPIHIGDGKPVVISGLSCCGLDYKLKPEFKASLEQLPDGIDVLFIHQAVRQALSFDGAWNADLADIPQSIKLVVMGDIHTQTEYALGSGGRALYTGSSHARDMEQRGPKSCTLVKSDLTTERLQLVVRDIERFAVQVPEDFTKVTDWLSKAVAHGGLKPFAWVQVLPTLQLQAEQLLKAYREHAICYVQSVVVAEQMQQAVELPTGVNTLVLLTQLLDPVKEPSAYQLALEMLDDRQNLPELLQQRYKA